MANTLPSITRKSRVPALSKGLEVLEALAREEQGLSQKDVADRVGRTVSEIFRVLGELEHWGYISRDPDTGLYTLTLRLFELAHIHPPTRRLISVAASKMQNLANRINVSCHAAMHQQDQLVIIAHALPDAMQMGWSVKVGAVFPFTQGYASARTIAAFQSPDGTERMLKELLSEDNVDHDIMAHRLKVIHDRGYEISASPILPGVTDISFPILNYLGHAIAALTVPTIDPLVSNEIRTKLIVPASRTTADEISQAIGGIRNPSTSLQT